MELVEAESTPDGGAAFLLVLEADAHIVLFGVLDQHGLSADAVQFVAVREHFSVVPSEVQNCDFQLLKQNSTHCWVQEDVVVAHGAVLQELVVFLVLHVADVLLVHGVLLLAEKEEVRTHLGTWLLFAPSERTLKLNLHALVIHNVLVAVATETVECRVLGRDRTLVGLLEEAVSAHAVAVASA